MLKFPNPSAHSMYVHISDSDSARGEGLKWAGRAHSRVGHIGKPQLLIRISPLFEIYWNSTLKNISFKKVFLSCLMAIFRLVTGYVPGYSLNILKFSIWLAIFSHSQLISTIHMYRSHRLLFFTERCQWRCITVSCSWNTCNTCSWQMFTILHLYPLSWLYIQNFEHNFHLCRHFTFFSSFL
jgi:hypothetical protein